MKTTTGGAGAEGAAAAASLDWSGTSVIRHEHHISDDGARALRGAGFDTDRLAALLQDASREAGLRFTSPARG